MGYSLGLHRGAKSRTPLSTRALLCTELEARLFSASVTLSKPLPSLNLVSASACIHRLVFFTSNHIYESTEPKGSSST